MKKTIILDIPKEYVEPLSDAYYDNETYRTILSELVLTKDDNIFNQSILKDFIQNYKQALIRYNTEKINFEFDFVKVNYPTAVSWSATFGDNKVLIEYLDNNSPEE